MNISITQIAIIGDVPTFESIYRGQFSNVCNVLRRQGVPPYEMEDAAHEVFLAVHRRLSSYDPQRPLRPWLYGFAARVAKRVRRRTWWRTLWSAVPIPDTQPDRSSFPDQIEARNTLSSLGRLLGRLNQDQRAVLLMAEIEGFTLPEIADALTTPLGTVTSRLRLARARLLHMVGSEDQQ